LSFAQAAGILRVSMDDELAGLDESHHGGSAYDFSAEGKATGPVA
jgi:ammonia channel protein AmtB